MSNKFSTGRMWRIALIIIIILVVSVGLVTGYLKRIDLKEQLRPTLDSVYVEIDKQSPQMATLRFYASFQNFLPFDVRFDSIKYEVEMNDTLLAAGQQLKMLKLESHQKASIPLPLRMSLDRLINGKKSEGSAVRLRFHLYTKFPLVGTREVQFGTKRDFKMSGGPLLGIQSADVNLLGEEYKVVNIFLKLNVLKNLPDSSHLDSIEMHLSTDEEEFLLVDKQKNIELGEKGQSITLPARLKFTRFRNILERKQDQDSMWVNISGYVALDMTNKLLVRFNLDRRIAVLRPPEITLDNWRVEHFALDTTQLLLTLKVVNQNNFGLSIHRIQYRFYVNDKLMAKENTTKAQRVGGNDTAFLVLPMKVNPAQAGWTSLKVLLGAKPEYRFMGTLNGTSDVEAVGNLNLRIRREGTINIKKITNK